MKMKHFTPTGDAIVRRKNAKHHKLEAIRKACDKILISNRPRDDRMKLMYEAGATLALIGSYFNLSKMRIGQILDPRRAAAAEAIAERRRELKKLHTRHKTERKQLAERHDRERKQLAGRRKKERKRLIERHDRERKQLWSEYREMGKTG
jgi:hypothetical protein